MRLIGLSQEIFEGAHVFPGCPKTKTVQVDTSRRLRLRYTTLAFEVCDERGAMLEATAVPAPAVERGKVRSEESVPSEKWPGEIGQPLR